MQWRRVAYTRVGSAMSVKRRKVADATLLGRNKRDNQCLTAATNTNLKSGDRWYVVFTQPQREWRARVHLAAQGFHTFLPCYRKTVRHARRLHTKRVPLFNRYLFIALDLDRDQWRRVNGTSGVACLVADENFPIPVTRGITETLIGLADASGIVNLGNTVEVGGRVRVLTGPFANFVGELVRLDGAQRVRVLLQLLGGPVAVSIDRGHLAPARAA